MDLRIKRPSENTNRSFQALMARAPQAEAFAERSAERLRPAFTWFYGARRRLATAAVGVLTVWLFLHVTFGANGMMIYRQKRNEYHSLQKEIGGLQQENGHYTQQINALQTDPATIEKEAREQLHYARAGEVIYVAPAPTVPTPPTTNSAQK